MFIKKTRCKMTLDALKKIINKGKYRLLTLKEYNENTCNKKTALLENDGSISYPDSLGETINYLTHTDEYLADIAALKELRSKLIYTPDGDLLGKFLNKYL